MHTSLLRRIPVALLALFIVGYIGIRFDVYLVVKHHITTAESRPPSSSSTGVVLGASVEHNQAPSTTLQMRLNTAVTLYKAGKVSRLLMSGDGISSPHYDEVRVMRQYALSQGVPAGAMDTDAKGLRTYDTCYRLQNVYHFNKVVLITQSDHLERAVYTCRELGLDADGVKTDQGSSWLSDPSFFLREQEAIILAWFDINILHPKPSTNSL